MLASHIPDVQAIVGMRNRLAHGYDADLDDVVLWKTATMSIPVLMEAVDQLLGQDPA